jgi:hypothetical protein
MYVNHILVLKLMKTKREARALRAVRQGCVLGFQAELFKL